MTLNEQKQQYSIAYVGAIVAATGFKIDRPVVDDDSVDLLIAARGPRGTTRSPELRVQLKCTAKTELEDGHFPFRLPLKNYSDLIQTDYMVPRILVMLTVPEKDSDWLVHFDDSLAMRHCGYWVSLRGMPPYEGESKNTKIPIRVPKDQRFTPDALNALFDRIGAGEKP